MLDLPLRGAMEPTIAEKADGGLLMVLRTELGSIFCSESTDGRQWSPPQTLGIGSPESRSSIARIPNSKDLVLAWNDSLYDPASRNGHFGRRTPLTVAISRDGGHTWINRKNVEADPNYEYTNIGIAFPSKGQMVLSYMASPSGANGGLGRAGIDLRNAIVPLKWLYKP
jgi:sialidase-1